MKKSLGVIIAVILVIVVIGASLVGSYNNLVNLEEKVNKEASNVSIMLERRADLIPNLVNVVKGYVSHEENVIKSITESREKLLNASTLEEKSKANEELSQAIDALMVIVENYPDLKASENFINLSDELAGTENRIVNARTNYNEAVQNYNSAIKKFPTNLLANWFGFEEKTYFEIEEAKQDVPKVEF